MVSEKQTFDTSSENDPFPFTTLRNKMLADGFDEETISNIVNTNLENPAAANEVYSLLRESKIRRGELPADIEPHQETPVPMRVQEKMGARAIGDTGKWRISGTLDDDKPQSSTSPQPYSPPEQTDPTGVDLSEEGIRAWVRKHHGH
jgi:hypothetical protein